MQFTLRAALLSGLAVTLASLSPASAQTGMTPQNATPSQARDRNDATAVVDAAALESGANSFTEGQARSRFEAAGFTNLQDLRKDDAGFWRARANRGGTSTEIALDFRGRIAAGSGVANLGTSNRGTGTTGTGGMTERTARPDGTPGNPPSTAVGRAVDRMQGETPRADGTPGNPPGTAAGRAVDRATGSNTTGANPAAPATPGGTTTR
jgi:hypothetical protein